MAEPGPLIVISSVKKYLKENFGLRTSKGALQSLQSLIKKELDAAALDAQLNKRETVMDRDISKELA